jgi:hypothetical protein
VNCAEEEPFAIVTEDGRVRAETLLVNAMETAEVAAAERFTRQVPVPPDVIDPGEQEIFLSVEGAGADCAAETLRAPPVPVTGMLAPALETPDSSASVMLAVPAVAVAVAFRLRTATTPAANVFWFLPERIQVYEPVAEEQERDLPAPDAAAPADACILAMLAAGNCTVHCRAAGGVADAGVESVRFNAAVPSGEVIADETANDWATTRVGIRARNAIIWNTTFIRRDKKGAPERFNLYSGHQLLERNGRQRLLTQPRGALRPKQPVRSDCGLQSCGRYDSDTL